MRIGAFGDRAHGTLRKEIWTLLFILTW